MISFSTSQEAPYFVCLLLKRNVIAARKYQKQKATLDTKNYLGTV
jgi:hypothetical protein